MKKEKEPLNLVKTDKAKILANNFIKESVITKEEFDSLYWQAKLIYEAINLPKLRQYSYLRLKNSIQDVYHDLIMDLDDEKDGIYKQIKISIDFLKVCIQKCQKVTNEYCIFECIEYIDEYQIYYYKTFLKTSYPNLEEFIPLSYKKWMYHEEKELLEEINNIDYTKSASSLTNNFNKANKNYIKCLSRNKKIHNNVDN